MFKMIEIFAKILPKGYRNKIEYLVEGTGLDMSSDAYAGFGVLMSFLLAAVTGAFFYFLRGFDYLIVAAVSATAFAVIQVVLYASLVFIVSKRKGFVDRVLPDALLLMAANIRSGVTPGRALLLSAKDEFGPLKDEIEKTARQIMAGEGLQEALSDFRERARSNTLKRVLSLIMSSIRTGGELATTLEETANNVRSLTIMKKRIKSNVVMYIIFIFIAAGFGAPALFSLSQFLIKAVSRFGGEVQMPERFARSTMFEMGSPNITPAFINRFSLITLGAISISGGLILGAIRSGEAKDGIKFIPLLLALSYGVFFLTNKIVNSIFSGLFF